MTQGAQPLGFDREVAAFLECEGGWMKHLALMLCGDWDRAADLAQEVGIKVYTHWGTIRRCSPAARRSYVVKTLATTYIDDERRSWRRREHPVVDFPVVGVRDPDPAMALAVRQALRMLPTQQRLAVVLRYWEQMTAKEAAELLGCDPGTVRAHALLGLRQLRSLLSEDQRLGGGS